MRLNYFPVIIHSVSFKVYTGTHPLGDSCSPFWEWEGVVESNLLECLRLNKITDVYICGVPTDIAIVPTVLDCMNHGMRSEINSFFFKKIKSIETETPNKS